MKVFKIYAKTGIFKAKSSTKRKNYFGENDYQNEGLKY